MRTTPTSESGLRAVWVKRAAALLSLAAVTVFAQPSGQGAARDLAAKTLEGAARKFAAAAYAELARGRNSAAIATAEKALANSKAVKIRFLAARTFIEAGDPGRARPIIDGLAAELLAEPRLTPRSSKLRWR